MTLSLPPELTIYTVAELRSAWVPMMADLEAAAPEPCVLDAASVQEVDGAGVQLLVALSKALSDVARPLVLTNTSVVLHQACNDLGCLEPLGLPAQLEAMS